jgi:selenocysteine-specific elongation factor
MVQVRLGRPGFFVPGDRFLVRRPSPSATLGGGTILACPRRKRKRRPGGCADLGARKAALPAIADFLRRLVVERGPAGITAREAAEETGRSSAFLEDRFRGLEESSAAVRLPGTDRFLDTEAADELKRGLLNRLRRHLEENPASEGADRKTLCETPGAPAPAAVGALALLAAEGKVELRGPKVRLRAEPAGSAPADPLEARVEALVRDWGLNPMPADALASSLGVPEPKLEAAIGGLLRRGAVHALGHRGYVHDASLSKARERILGFFRSSPGAMLGFTAARGFLGVSNRVSEAVLRHFQEKEGFLVNVGNLFALKPGLFKAGSSP